MAKLNPSNNPNKARIAERTVPLSLSASDFFRLRAMPMRHAELGKTDEQDNEASKRDPLACKTSGQIFDRALR